jgi:hypothetical protein
MSMSFIRVIAGDFCPGRVEFDDVGFAMRCRAGRNEVIEFGDVREVRALEHERNVMLGDRVAGVAVGGIIGGVAAGALAGGLTGPAGAVLGAVAGAILSVRRKFLTCRVELRDSRAFVATARSETWAAIRDTISRSPLKPVILDVAPQATRAIGRPNLFEKFKGRLPWLRRNGV